MMSARCTTLGLALSAAIVALMPCPRALALPAIGTQVGQPLNVASSAPVARDASLSCSLAPPPIGGTLPGACEAGEKLIGKAAGGLVGEAISAAGGSAMNALAEWMIGAATTVTRLVAREMQQVSTPKLGAAWFEAQFVPMADLGAALGLLVSLIALASAAIRRDPSALAATLTGIARAGLGTGLVVALTTLGLEIADEVSNAVLANAPHSFWKTVAHAWGASGFGGFESSALATLIALVEVLVAIFVLLELIVRDAGLYVAVMFFPVVLAASIWPSLSSWTGRLARIQLLLIVLKPVALIVLCLAGSAAAAGLSFGGGISGSVGTILTAIVIFALAAFAPWVLMFLLAADAETGYAGIGLRTGAAGALSAQQGRSLRNLGGLRSNSGFNVSLGGGGPSTGGRGRGPGSGPSGPGSAPSNPSGPGSGPPSGSSSPPGAQESGESETLPVQGGAVGAGSLGAAAGRAGQALSANDDTQDLSRGSPPELKSQPFGEEAEGTTSMPLTARSSAPASSASPASASTISSSADDDGSARPAVRRRRRRAAASDVTAKHEDPVAQSRPVAPAGGAAPGAPSQGTLVQRPSPQSSQRSSGKRRTSPRPSSPKEQP